MPKRAARRALVQQLKRGQYRMMDGLLAYRVGRTHYAILVPSLVDRDGNSPLSDLIQHFHSPCSDLHLSASATEGSIVDSGFYHPRLGAACVLGVKYCLLCGVTGQSRL